jgi:glycosyltransferase involved in cell wall biosynthesis
MSDRRVTIAIPTYNRAGLIGETIKSVLSQTYQDFDLLVSDDASTDNTREVVASFNDPRIRYYHHESNIGLARNYQFVLQEPKTEFVSYLSDDDLYCPDHLETALHALDLYPQAAYFASAARYFGGEETGLLRPRAITDTQTQLLYFAPSEAVHFLGIDPPGLMTVCRRKALDTLLYWPPSNYQPIDLFMQPQLMTRGGITFSNRPVYMFRLHTGNASRAPRLGLKRSRFNCMVWYAIRWLAQYLISSGLCTAKDIEMHGLNARSEQLVVPLVMALGSFDSPPPLRVIAKRVFNARADIDSSSARFRLARRACFWVIPVSEKLTQYRTGWKPRRDAP